MDAATRATVVDKLREDAAEGITGGASTRDQNTCDFGKTRSTPTRLQQTITEWPLVLPEPCTQTEM